MCHAILFISWGLLLKEQRTQHIMYILLINYVSLLWYNSIEFIAEPFVIVGRRPFEWLQF